MREPRQHPSCSGFEALSLCPGKLVAERGLPDQRSADAESGTAIHASLAGAPIRELDDDERDVYRRCNEEVGALVAQIFPGIKIGQLKAEKELRLWSLGQSELSWSGQADLIVHDGGKALVVDYKCGRNDVPVAADNLQLAGLAVLAWQSLMVAPVTVAIVAPRQSPCVTVATYTVPELKAARALIHEVIQAAAADNPPRRPGEKQCRYCKAAGTARCPESQSVVTETAALEPVSTPPGAVLGPDDIARLLDRCALAETVIKRIKDAAHEMAESGITIPGYRLRPGAVRETITDPQAVFTRCASHGVTVEGFLATVSVAKGRLKTALGEAAGVKGKALDALLLEVTAGCVESKQCAASLCKE